MNWIDIEWKTITPLLLHRIDSNNYSELRTPPIKSSMRYWWRALHGNYDIGRLLEEESKIFGSSNEKYGKSKFQIRILPKSNIRRKNFQILPTRTFRTNGIEINQNFTIRIQTFQSLDFLLMFVELLYLSLLLGGLGQRSRRAFGALMFNGIKNGSQEILEKDKIKQLNENRNSNQIDINHLLNLWTGIINDLSELDYTLDIEAQRINLSQDQGLHNIPYLKSVKIGRKFQNWDSLWRKINQLCHDIKGRHDRDRRIRNEYKSMGYAERYGKMASTLYISALKIGNNYYPLLSKLNPVFDPDLRSRPNDPERVPNEFISELS